MKLERLIPILNVSNIEESFAWFEKLGWQKGWDWGDPPRVLVAYAAENAKSFSAKTGRDLAAAQCLGTSGTMIRVGFG